MAATISSRNRLLMLHTRKEKDVIASYKLKTEINKLQREFCFTLESYASQSYPQSMDHAIGTAQFYLLFLTKALLKYDDQILVSGINTILQRIQDKSHKLAIVLYKLSMSNVKGKRSLNLLQYELENAIDTSLPGFKKDNNSKEYKWEKIADQVYKKLNIDPRATISYSPLSDSNIKKTQIFFYHDQNDDDERRATVITEFLQNSSIACNIKRSYLDFVWGRLKDLIAKHIHWSDVTFALLTSKWKKGDWNKFIADILAQNNCAINPLKIVLVLDGVDDQELGRDYVILMNRIKKDPEKGQDDLHFKILDKLKSVINQNEN